MSDVLSGAEKFYYEGNNIGVLVIHGFTGTTQSMRPLGQKLAQAGFTVLGPCLKGHGTSPRNMVNASFQDWQADVENALNELRAKTKHIFVIGLSMGGTLTLYLAENHQDIVGIILINAAVEMGDFEKFYFEQKNNDIAFIDSIDADIKKEGSFELAYRQTPIKSMKDLLDLIKLVKKDLSKITSPTLIFSSTADHVVPPYNSQIILDEISSAKKELITLKESYHVATLDNDFDFIVEKSIAFITTMMQ